MALRRALTSVSCILLVVSALAQGNRGKAELDTAAGAITIDYGRPSLKGRDMLSRLQVGQYWRMGMNQATVLATPVDLSFGTVKVPKGSYSLWLKLAAQHKYELVVNSQTGQWGTQHDTSSDLCEVPLKEESSQNPVEVFTIELSGAPEGGVFSLSWGSTVLSADFRFAK